jgi:hypothetical protein
LHKTRNEQARGIPSRICGLKARDAHAALPIARRAVRVATIGAVRCWTASSGIVLGITIPGWIRERERVVRHIRIPVERLPVRGAWHGRVCAQCAPQRGVVEPRVEVDEAEIVDLLLARIAARGVADGVDGRAPCRIGEAVRLAPIAPGIVGIIFLLRGVLVGQNRRRALMILREIIIRSTRQILRRDVAAGRKIGRPRRAPGLQLIVDTCGGVGEVIQGSAARGGQCPPVVLRRVAERARGRTRLKGLGHVEGGVGVIARRERRVAAVRLGGDAGHVPVGIVEEVRIRDAVHLAARQRTPARGAGVDRGHRMRSRAILAVGVVADIRLRRDVPVTDGVRELRQKYNIDPNSFDSFSVNPAPLLQQPGGLRFVHWATRSSQRFCVRQEIESSYHVSI